VTLHGLPLSLLLQVGGAVAAVVTLLYLLKLRRRHVRVPFSPLWARVAADPESRSLLRALKRLLSWLLALAFVALVAGAAGDPRPHRRVEDARTYVVLLDASASMRALDGYPSRFEDARRHALAVVDGLRVVDQAMIVRVTGDVEPLTPFSGDRRTLREAIESAEPGESAADLTRALAFAAAALHGRRGPRLVLLTDGAGRPVEPPPGLPPLSVEVVGTAADNVGILAFNARPYRSNRREYEVFLRVRNDAARPVRCRLSLSADGVLSEVLPLEVPAKSAVDRMFEGIVVTGRRLQAELEVVEGPADLLDLDNRAYALLPERRPQTVRVVGPGNLFLEAALLLDDSLEVTTVGPEGYPGAEEPPDAWVFDRFAPDTPPEQPALYLAPPADRSPWRQRGLVEVPERIRVRPGHPLGRWIGLPDLNAPAAAQVVPGARDTVVVTAERVPLVVAREDEGRRSVLWTFDPLASDLPLRTAFPLMLMHTFEWFAREEAGFVSSYAVGRSWRVPVGAGAEVRTAELVEPGGHTRQVPVEEGRARVRGRRAGFHTLRVEGRPPVVIAASLADPAESDLAPRPELLEDRRTPMELSRTAAGGRPPWVLLALVAVLWLVLEWPAFHRRWTV